eukprot:scaffold39695_cov206-Amphora_coffeaeformis.AAC.1
MEPYTVTLEGICLPVEKDLQHHPENENTNSLSSKMRFNGAGVRSINIFGWDFKVYVAGFYHAGPDLLRSTDDVYEAIQQHPMQFDFTFLRTVPQSKVTEAWERQLDHSVDYHYEQYERDRDAFVSSFGPISHSGTVSVVLHPCGRTILVDQGTPKNVIQSRDFQRSFLSMWFGEKAVHQDLKEGLLSRGSGMEKRVA